MPEDTPRPGVRKLKIVDCKVGHTGEKNGKPFVIYDIKATKPDGSPIPPDMTLRAFTELPIGQVVEVEVKKFTSSQGKISYTLIPEKGQTTARVNELAQRVEALEGVAKGMADRIAALERAVTTHIAPPQAPAGVPAVGPGGNDDIPF